MAPHTRAVVEQLKRLKPIKFPVGVDKNQTCCSAASLSSNDLHFHYVPIRATRINKTTSEMCPTKECDTRAAERVVISEYKHGIEVFAITFKVVGNGSNNEVVRPDRS